MSGALKRHLVPSNGPDADEVLSLASEVAARLQHRFVETNRSMNAAIKGEVEGLDDPELTDMLHASVEGNIATILHMIRNNIPLGHVQPITAATEYAIRLARADIPSTSLRRAYHIGSDDLLSNMFEEIQQLDCSSDVKLRLLHHLAGWMHKYVDWIARVVLEAHEEERRTLLEQNASVTSMLVQRVLEQQPVNIREFALNTGYRLDQTHVGAVLWIEGVNQGTDQAGTLSAFADTLATTLGSSGAPLFTPVSRSMAWAWIGSSPGSPSVDVSQLRPALQKELGMRVALGKPVSGIEGFRATHEQAETVKGVASAAPLSQGRAVYYGDDGVAIVAMLAKDLAATRRWVGEVLGPMAVDSASAERLRETLRVFMRTGESYAETSKELVLHRNTVKYRLAKAEQTRGRPVSDGRLDLKLALETCHLLGHSVLRAQADASSASQIH